LITQRATQAVRADKPLNHSALSSHTTRLGACRLTIHPRVPLCARLLLCDMGLSHTSLLRRGCRCGALMLFVQPLILSVVVALHHSSIRWWEWSCRQCASITRCLPVLERKVFLKRAASSAKRDDQQSGLTTIVRFLLSDTLCARASEQSGHTLSAHHHNQQSGHTHSVHISTINKHSRLTRMHTPSPPHTSSPCPQRLAQISVVVSSLSSRGPIHVVSSTRGTLLR
jgi:hypothetical protein